MTTPNEGDENDVKIAAEQFTEKDDIPPQSSDIFANYLVSISGVRYSCHLFKSIDEIEIPIRAHNAFVKAGIIYLGDLLSIPCRDLISMANLGRKALESVAASIAKLGLEFDMEIESWPPADLVDLRKQYEIEMDSKAKNEIEW